MVRGVHHNLALPFGVRRIRLVSRCMSAPRNAAMMSHEPVPTIDLPPGTVHRLVVDLVRVGLWSEQQGAATPTGERHRQLGLTSLACRLAAEVVRDTLCVPFPVTPKCPHDAFPDGATDRGCQRAFHQKLP